MGMNITCRKSQGGMKMTRKQAISRAIDILSRNKENVDIVLKLQELYSEMPLSSWTKDSIIDSIETYALEHDNILPQAKDLISENRLPSNTVIGAKFNMTSMESFFKKYFPHLNKKNNYSSPYKDKGEDYFIEIFKDNYTRIQKSLGVKVVSAKTYNKNRQKETPFYGTIVKQCGCNSYDDLLIKCGYKKAHSTISTTLIVSYNDKDNYDNSVLKDIIGDVKK